MSLRTIQCKFSPWSNLNFFFPEESLLGDGEDLYLIKLQLFSSTMSFRIFVA